MSVSDKQLLFGGATGEGAGTPWATLGEITRRALATHGYSVTIEGRSWGPNNPRYLADGRVDLGATQLSRVRAAYQGTGDYQPEGPRANLRLIACINHAGWIGVATRWESGITDLRQIAEQRLPVRVVDRQATVTDALFAHYGLTREGIEGWGGRFVREGSRGPGLPHYRGEWLRSGDFDLLIGYIYTGFAPEVEYWHEASVLYNLRFFPLPEAILPHLCQELGGEPGELPHHIVRGVLAPQRSVTRGPQAIYVRDDTPDDFAYLLTQALDEGRRLFRQVHLPYSYDPQTVAHSPDVPMHPAAARYYQEHGYPM